MLVPIAPDTRGRRRAANANYMTEDATTHKFVRNLVSNTKVISPDDENVKLTETMKKTCKGKTIFFNSQHYVEVGDQQEDRKTKVIDFQNKRHKNFVKLLPKRSNTQLREDRSLCHVNDTKVKLILWKIFKILYLSLF